MTRTAALGLILCAISACAEAPSFCAPRDQDYPWMSVAAWTQRHDSFVRRAAQGKIDLLFLGDSITEGWNNNAVWQKHYAPLNAANFGIGGDTVQNLHWRTLNGETDRIAPKVVVLLIGTNNFGIANDPPDAVAQAVTALVRTLRRKLPSSKILLLAMFPRDARPGTDFRNRIVAANRSIAALDDGRHVRFLDLGPKFLAADGSIPPDIMPDALHLTEKAYALWAATMAPLLAEMMGN